MEIVFAIVAGLHDRERLVAIYTDREKAEEVANRGRVMEREIESGADCLIKNIRLDSDHYEREIAEWEASFKKT